MDPTTLLPDHHAILPLIAVLTDAQVIHVLRQDHDLWDDDQFASVLSTPEHNRRLLRDHFAHAVAVGDAAAELARFQVFITTACRALPAPPRPGAVATFPIDARVQPLVDGLSDAQVEDVLGQMNDAWTPQEALEYLLGTPALNRAVLIETFTLNIGMGGETEFATLERFAAVARGNAPTGDAA